MRITKNTIETTPGPREWFTGAAYIDAIATPTGPSRVSASSVRLTPGAQDQEARTESCSVTLDGGHSEAGRLSIAG